MLIINMCELEDYISAGSDLYCGIAWQREISALQYVVGSNVAEVIFEPGTSTRWHSHSGYQVIMVTGGQGFYQEKGSEKQCVNVGDVIKIRPDTLHMHSASPNSSMIHTAITFNEDENVVTVWNDI